MRPASIVDTPICNFKSQLYHYWTC